MRREESRTSRPVSGGGLGRAEAAFVVDALRFRYGRRADRGAAPVLDGLSFEVASGEVLGVIGPNGSGKTSLLKLLARVLRATEGTIRLFGEDLGGLPQEAVARRVAFVPQESVQPFPFTIMEMVLLGRFVHLRPDRGLGGFGWEGPEDVRVARLAMADTDVAHMAHRPISAVSGGERQRAIIARALAQEPRVLLLDEPTAFLDLHHQLEICRILRRLNEERGLTVVMASHDLTLASQYCDRLLLLDQGRISRIGHPEEVVQPDVLAGVYGCEVLVDRHPGTGLPRVTLPGRLKRTEHMANG